MSDSAAERAVELISAWYAGESGGIGIANTGLRIAEFFRNFYPLTDDIYLSEGGAQVRGLSGNSGNLLISKFDSSLARLGTEAGRTSRGTPMAAKRLAGSLNAEHAVFGRLTDDERAVVADAMQGWVVDNPIREELNKERLRFSYNPQAATTANIASLLAAADERKRSGCVAQHLVAAKLAIRFPNVVIPDHPCSAADAVTGRDGDFQIADTVFHVTVAPGPQVVAKCGRNVKSGLRPVLLVPERRYPLALSAVVEAGLEESVTVYVIEGFVAQNIEEMSEFDGKRYRGGLRSVLDEYNRRVAKAESDHSIMVQIPGSL